MPVRKVQIFNRDPNIAIPSYSEARSISSVDCGQDNIMQYGLRNDYSRANDSHNLLTINKVNIGCGLVDDEYDYSDEEIDNSTYQILKEPKFSPKSTQVQTICDI